MHPLLQKWLNRLGINSVDELNEQEKVKFDEWRRIFTTEQVSVDQISAFCTGQISVIEQRWADMTLDNDSKAQLIALHTAYKSILGIISSPLIEKERLERHLSQFLSLQTVIK